MNLRRLLAFHHASNREAARALGITEQTVSGWLNGRRQPSSDALLKISRLYNLDTRVLFGDEFEFVRALGDPDRFRSAGVLISDALRALPSRDPVPIGRARRRR